MIPSNDHLAILALYNHYNNTIDAGDAATWAMTFTADGSFHHPSREFRGRAELEIFVQSRSDKVAAHQVMHQRHWNDAIVLEGDSAHVSGKCLLLVAGVDRDTLAPTVLALGEYADEVVKDGSQWRFKKRSLKVY